VDRLSGMGEISTEDLSFYETRWILKFSFKHCLMNEIEVFFN